jgi:hypothetical protein
VTSVFRSFGLNTLVYCGVLLLAAYVEASSVGWSIEVFGGVIAIQLPGAILSSLMLVGSPARRRPRLVGGILAAAVSTASTWITVSFLAERFDTGPYPFDPRPLMLVLAAVAGLTGLAAGAAAVALRQALERSSR